MNYILLFLEGIITFISPCILPMIPIYVSYFAGGDIDNKNYKNRALISSIAFVAGFTLVFTLLGVAAGTVGVIFNTYMREINIVSGSIMIIFGLNYLGIINVELLHRSFKINKPTGHKKILYYVYSIIWNDIWIWVDTVCRTISRISTYDSIKFN